MSYDDENVYVAPRIAAAPDLYADDLTESVCIECGEPTWSTTRQDRDAARGLLPGPLCHICFAGRVRARRLMTDNGHYPAVYMCVRVADVPEPISAPEFTEQGECDGCGAAIWVDRRSRALAVKMNEGDVSLTQTLCRQCVDNLLP